MDLGSPPCTESSEYSPSTLGIVVTSRYLLQLAANRPAGSTFTGVTASLSSAIGATRCLRATKSALLMSETRISACYRSLPLSKRSPASIRANTRNFGSENRMA